MASTWRRTEGHLRGFVRHGLVVDQVLADHARQEMTMDAQVIVGNGAVGLPRETWSAGDFAAAFPTESVPPDCAVVAAETILCASATVMATLATGRGDVDADVAREAVGRLRGFIEEYGFVGVVDVYGAVTAWEDCTAIAYNGSMPEAAFVTGSMHRPWAMQLLDTELLAGQAAGLFRIAPREHARHVWLTPKGERTLRRLEGLLERSGYFAARRAVLTTSGFNLVNVEDVFREEGRNAEEVRRTFVPFAGLRPGDRVLECGAGDGANLFEGGLLDTVGVRGHVVATDPAVAPLQRLQARAERAGVQNVETRVARAERLPFSPGSFDAVVGTFFLQFTDLARAMRETMRVCRPGARVAFAVFTTRPYAEMAWYRDWFAPILDLAARFGVQPSMTLQAPGEVAAALATAGASDVQTQVMESLWVVRRAETTVAHLVQATDFFSAVMRRVPWKAQAALVADLVARGQGVIARTTEEERTFRQPVELVRALAQTCVRKSERFRS